MSNYSYKTKKSKNQYIKSSIVTSDQFNADKIVRYRNSVSMNNNSFSFYTPIYSYSDNIEYPLMIKTDFIDLTIDPFKLIKKDVKKFIILDTNDKSVKHLYTPLSNFSKNVFEFIQKQSKFPNRLTEQGPVLSNHTDERIKSVKVDFYQRMKNLKLFLPEFNGKIKTTVYNYNKSKKYDPVETYDSIELNELARFLIKGKQVRFILEPKVWFNSSTQTYGIKLYVKFMEVKYKDQLIKSELDENQVEIINPVKFIEI